MFNKYRVVDKVVFVKMKNVEFIIDLKDLEKVSRKRWYLCSGYARDTTQEYIYLHHYLLGKKEGFEIDHKNRNKLDNRRSNLRHVTSFGNKINRGLNKNSTSGFMGVSFNKDYKKWEASIGKNYKKILLGYFDSKELAIRARQKGELKHHL